MSTVAWEMTMPFVHKPVLLEAVLELVTQQKPRLIVDCTVGGAGHARALLSACPEARLIGLDRDPDAVAEARRVLTPFGTRASVVRAPFSQLEAVLAERGGQLADVVLADLGVSSYQLDTPARGFSFRLAGPLDMRMDPEAGESALELIARFDERTLADAIRQLGEERYARKVARAIKQAEPRSTDALAALVRSVVPKAKDGIDPATRTFQALRMLVNRELEELEALLASLPRVLSDGGLALIISFHSLEDRAVKRAFREAARGCTCPPSLPTCVCGKVPLLDVVTPKPVVADAAEVRDNPRARSAKLRVARRLVRTA